MRLLCIEATEFLWPHRSERERERDLSRLLEKNGEWMVWESHARSGERGERGEREERGERKGEEKSRKKEKRNNTLKKGPKLFRLMAKKEGGEKFANLLPSFR